jgi:hypothetical protein
MSTCPHLPSLSALPPPRNGPSSNAYWRVHTSSWAPTGTSSLGRKRIPLRNEESDDFASSAQPRRVPAGRSTYGMMVLTPRIAKAAAQGRVLCRRARTGVAPDGHPRCRTCRGRTDPGRRRGRGPGSPTGSTLGPGPGLHRSTHHGFWPGRQMKLAGGRLSERLQPGSIRTANAMATRGHDDIRWVYRVDRVGQVHQTAASPHPG